MDIKTAKKLVESTPRPKQEKPKAGDDRPRPVDLDVSLFRVKDPEHRDPHLKKRQVSG